LLQTLSKKIKFGYLSLKFFYRKLVKATINCDRLSWLKSLDENLKLQPKQFWKYVTSFRKINYTSIQLEVDGKHLIEPCEVAYKFSRHFSQYRTVFALFSSPPLLHHLNL
jgi:hypothetical protein